MKSKIIGRVFGLLAAGLSALSLSMCSKGEFYPFEEPRDEYVLSITSASAASSETRTCMEPSAGGGKYDALWQSGDLMEIYIDSVSTSDRYTLANDVKGEVATFVGKVGSNEGTRTLYGFYPSAARAAGTEDGGHTVSVDLPYVQSPTKDSFDPLCDILAAAPMEVTFAKGQSASISNARFARQMAILKIVPVDATEGGILSEDKVLTVKITAGEGAVLSGRAKLDLENASISEWTSQSIRNHVMGVYSEKDEFGVNGSDGAFLMVAPGTLEAGSPLALEASTDSHLLGRELVLSSSVAMPAGKLTTLKVKLDDSCVQDSGASLPFVEDFSSVTSGNSTTTSGSSTAWKGNENFPDVLKAYQAGGSVRIGTGNSVGSISTKNLNLAQPFTVSFKLKGWTSEGSVNVTAGSQSFQVSYTAVMTDSLESVTLPFYPESSVCRVTFASTSDARRCFIDDVSITVRKNKTHAIVTEDQLSLPYSAGKDVTFNITSDYAWTATASSGALFTFSPQNGPEGRTAVTLTSTSENSSYSSRLCGSITISDGTVSKTVNVSQSGKPNPAVQDWAELPSPTSGDNLELCRHSSLPSNPDLRNYSFLFDKNRHCSLWVAWPLHPCYVGSASRTGFFTYDPDFILDDYEADLSGGAYWPWHGKSFEYSRGHQLPSAERTASSADNATTFYSTNMTPQLQAFNGFVWEELEKLERTAYICSDTLYIVTGPYFDPSATPYYTYDCRGYGKACQVPTHYWKLYLRTKSGKTGKSVAECSSSDLKCVGFWFEHEARNGTPKASDLRSVSEIEALTGFTFFPNVPDAPKDSYTASEWGF